MSASKTVTVASASEYQGKLGEFSIVKYRRDGDGHGVSRVRVERNGFVVELLPSKGLSIGEAWHDGSPLFWSPPRRELPSPSNVDPDGPVRMNGEKIDGIRWVDYFTGGVEMLGLRNWGMPKANEAGDLLPLHGEASLTPVGSLIFVLTPEGLTVKGEMRLPGEFGVSKTIKIHSQRPALTVEDTITNLAKYDQSPDWGYHVQLRPEEGAVYYVPADTVIARGGGPLEEEYFRWREAHGKKREERGYIHTGCRYRNQSRVPSLPTLLRYSSGSGISVCLPRVPYFQSWFCAGGAGSDEFMVPAADSDKGDYVPVLQRDWNGVGPEFGSSSLDHRDDELNFTPDCVLKSGESLEVHFEIEALDAAAAGRLENEILEMKD